MDRRVWTWVLCFPCTTMFVRGRPSEPAELVVRDGRAEEAAIEATPVRTWVEAMGCLVNG